MASREYSSAAGRAPAAGGAAGVAPGGYLRAEEDPIVVRDLLLLTRAPLALSAAANVVTGALVLRDPAAPWRAEEAGALALLALASCCAYWAGMVLNDRFDLERDRALYPDRPLPAGRVSPVTASLLGGGLLVALLALATLAGAALGQGAAARGALGAVALAACILAYDGLLKAERLPGALAMGACRAANALLGAFVLGAWEGPRELGPALLYALLLGMYVVYLTVLSFYEDEDAPPDAVATGCLGTTLPPALVALATLAGPVRLHPLALVGALPLALVALAQGFAVIEQGTRARGERTTRALLRAIYLLDVALLLGTRHWVAAGAVALAGLVAMAAARLLFAPPPARLDDAG
ncbi:MAG: UbiA family prenyltransferase [Planctomycetes bacterium]|nr:UbiA family prenyltransferase [Planctomycetota bacterium]